MLKRKQSYEKGNIHLEKSEEKAKMKREEIMGKKKEKKFLKNIQANARKRVSHTVEQSFSNNPVKSR